MIPKIIHYCWFGKQKKPNDVIQYIETWKRYLPNYIIKEWNESNYDYKKIRYTREAYRLKKYAFVSDVCRLYALYNEGGIYFDTDIEVIKPFTKFENYSSFIGYEVNDLIGTGVIGSMPRSKWIGMILDSYKNEHFIGYNGLMNFYPNTQRITDLLTSISDLDKPEIFPLDVFCAMHWKTKEEYVTENTVSIHHYKSSWVSSPTHKYDVFEQKICNKLKIRNRHLIIRFCKKMIW